MSRRRANPPSTSIAAQALRLFLMLWAAAFAFGFASELLRVS